MEMFLSDEMLFCEGNSAYWDGYPAASNPYDRGNKRSRAWAKGWAEARREEMSMKKELGITKPSVPTNETE